MTHPLGCPWVWLSAAAAGSVAVLAWHRYRLDAGPQASWLDAHQPPPVLDAQALAVCPTGERLRDYRPAGPRAQAREYPPSLSAWPCSPVGDC